MSTATVVVPVYNACSGPQGDAWLRRLFDSLQAQTFANWTAIVINDGSTDDSLRVLEDIAALEPRLKLIDKPNEGVSKTRNLGISLADGDYLFFIDQDDYVAPDYFEKFIDAAILNSSDIVVGGYRRLDNKGNEISRLDPVIGNDFYKWIITAPWARVFKTDWLQEKNVRFLESNIGEDLYFNARAYSEVAKSQGRVALIEYSGYIWFYNDESVSNTRQKGLQPSVTVSFLLDQLACVEMSETETLYFSQFIVRYVVWYLLYSGREASSERFIEVSHDLVRWLNGNGYKPAFSFWDKRIACEPLTNRLAVAIFYAMLPSDFLLSLFSRFYCRGSHDKG